MDNNGILKVIKNSKTKGVITMNSTITGNTEVSLEAVVIFVNELANEQHKIIPNEVTGTRVIVPASSSLTEVFYDFSDEKGVILTDKEGTDVTAEAKVICFGDDTNNGKYYVLGITNGTLSIAGKPRITAEDINRLVEIENSL